MSPLCCAPRNEYPLFSVEKWSDIGTNINMKCSMRDDENNIMFAPSSSTMPTFLPGPGDPHSKFSSYKVLRDGMGRALTIHYALPDHDGINRTDIEYADNDETDLFYTKKVTFNAVNSGGIKEVTWDFNGNSVDVTMTGNITAKTAREILVRNDMLWTNAVSSSSEPLPFLGAKKVRGIRTLDGKGRVVREEVFSLDGRKEELLETKSYSWAEIGETGVAIESIEFRDGKGNLTERLFYAVAHLLQNSTTNILAAAKVRYERTEKFCDVILFDKSGTNVVCRLRFLDDAKMPWRTEFRSDDGAGLVTTNRCVGGNVAVHEELKFKVDDAPFVAKGDRLVCHEKRWLDANGKPAACSAGWATCKTYTNDDLIDDVDDPRFTGQVRRIEYLGPDGKICQKLNWPGMAAVREFDHDRYGRVVEIRTLSAENKLFDMYSFNDKTITFFPAVFTVKYDALGRPRCWVQLNSKRQPVNQCETIITYAGDSRIPSKIEVVNKDGTRTDVTNRKKDFSVLTDPQLMVNIMQSGSFGFEVKDQE